MLLPHEDAPEAWQQCAPRQGVAHAATPTQCRQRLQLRQGLCKGCTRVLPHVAQQEHDAGCWPMTTAQHNTQTQCLCIDCQCRRRTLPAPLCRPLGEDPPLHPRTATGGARGTFCNPTQIDGMYQTTHTPDGVHTSANKQLRHPCITSEHTHSCRTQQASLGSAPGGGPALVTHTHQPPGAPCAGLYTCASTTPTAVTPLHLCMVYTVSVNTPQGCTQIQAAMKCTRKGTLLARSWCKLTPPHLAMLPAFGVGACTCENVYTGMYVYGCSVGGACTQLDSSCWLQHAA
jgi:hypothetical protein